MHHFAVDQRRKRSNGREGGRIERFGERLRWYHEEIRPTASRQAAEIVLSRHQAGIEAGRADGAG
jgi:hypothetical protein